MSRLFEALTGVSLLGMSAMAVGFGLKGVVVLSEIKLVQHGATAILVSMGALLLVAGVCLIHDAVRGDGYEWW